MPQTAARNVDVVVIGAGAAGMMAAIEAGKRGRSVLVIDHAAAPGEKIRISGGGRCNFTNLHTAPAAFISANPAFCISALSRYRPADFIALVDRHGIAWHEKARGQLFCDGSAKQIITLLMQEMAAAGVQLSLATTIAAVSREAEGFALATSEGGIAGRALIVASGGKSIPKMGASGYGYELAAQFGLRVTPTRPALVPLTFETGLLARTAPLAGLSVEGVVAAGDASFDEAVLFTHRGLSGPAILQVSSYWREGDEIAVNLAPGVDVPARLKAARATNGRQSLQTALATLLPRRLAQFVTDEAGIDRPLAELGDAAFREVAARVSAWRVKPVGSEGYRTAEVTLGGVDTRDLDQKTMMARTVPGLFFVGEVVDVTGWLGGYNFQWAWASGWAAGQAA